MYELFSLHACRIIISGILCCSHKRPKQRRPWKTGLPQALLAKAFRGELVEQLPIDGDAWELLEEIHKAKAGLENYVANTFKNTSASEIADISHREPAWKENIDGKKIIPYSFSLGLETV